MASMFRQYIPIQLVPLDRSMWPRVGSGAERSKTPTPAGGDADEQVVGAGLGILNYHVKVAVVVKDAGIEEFEFQVLSDTLAVLLHELPIGGRSGADSGYL